jgi:CheY-like chemotaxis protein
MNLWGIRVLAVDDDPDTLDLITRILQAAGAHVVTARTTGEALATIVGVTPDVMLVDIGIPGEDGFALMRKVRTLSPEKGGRIPAATVSAYPMTDERLLEWRSAGFQRHLAKPFGTAQLREVVASLAGAPVERRGTSRRRSEWPSEVSRERRYEDRRHHYAVA